MKLSVKSKLSFITIILIGMGVVFFFNPNEVHIYPPCIFHKITHLYCPGCGMTRGVYYFLHGQFLMAIRENLLLLFVVIGLALEGVYKLEEKILKRKRIPFYKRRSALYVFFVLVVVYWILRNIPEYPFTLLRPF